MTTQKQNNNDKTKSAPLPRQTSKAHSKSCDYVSGQIMTVTMAPWLPCNIPYITAKANERHFGFHGKISLGYLFAIVFCCVIIIMWGWLGTEPKASHEFFQITPCWVSLSQTGRKSCEGDTAWPSVRRTQPTCSPDVLTLVVPCLAFPIVAATLREKADTLWDTGHRAVFPKILRTRSLSGWVTQSSLHSILKYFHSGQ